MRNYIGLLRRLIGTVLDISRSLQSHALLLFKTHDHYNLNLSLFPLKPQPHHQAPQVPLSNPINALKPPDNKTSSDFPSKLSPDLFHPSTPT